MFYLLKDSFVVVVYIRSVIYLINNYLKNSFLSSSSSIFFFSFFFTIVRQFNYVHWHTSHNCNRPLSQLAANLFIRLYVSGAFLVSFEGNNYFEFCTC